MKDIVAVSVVLLLTGLAGCTSGRHSPAGFRLPEDGDVEKGRVAFVELKCHLCHKVAGEDQLPPTVELPSPVVLGGKVYEVRTDGYLVTSIIHPSHRLAVKDESRMPDLTGEMTVRQLVDLVAYLQSRYEVAPPPYTYYQSSGCEGGLERVGEQARRSFDLFRKRSAFVAMTDGVSVDHNG